MAKAIARHGAPQNKKGRHTAAQKKAAAKARAAAAHPGAKGRHPAADERAERPRRQWEDRPQRSERAERPRRQWEDRPQRSERPERAPYTRQAPRSERTPYQAPQPRPAVEVGQDNGFATMGLDPRLVTALAQAGINAPFPIQAATIPDALAGRDVLGRGQTGSGKTLAFGLPTVHRLAQGAPARPGQVRALVMTPTRELAMQVIEALRPMLGALRLKHQLVAGGMSYTPQLRSLEQGVDLLVATPGRLADLIERGAADLSQVEVTVLDEADHMSEMGFLEAITEILDLTPAGGQRLLFSATLDHGIDQVAQRYLADPVTHSTNEATASVDTMEHHVFLVHPHEKRTVISTIANRSGRTLVFARTKLGADRVAEQLREAGVFAAALHGGLNQSARTRVLEAFKSGELSVLVATDVAARGIHVDDISLVLQVDPAADHKDYLHRSGRTARAGERGTVVTLALPHQKRKVGQLLSSAGVQSVPQTVSPSHHAVLRTAGGQAPSGEPIPYSRLEELLRPRRTGRRPGQGGHHRGGRRYGQHGSGRPPRRGQGYAR